MLALLLIAAMLAMPATAAESPRLRVLATGDSMVEPLDEQIAPYVKRADGRLTRDPRPGTGISKLLTLDWVRYAARQAKKYTPGATVMFIGANDWEPLRSEDGPEVECCRRSWIDAYAKRAKRIMRAYERRSAGRVYWLTLPAPRDKEHGRRFAAVNAALTQAAASAGDGVVLIDTVPVLSPGNVYHRTIRWRGRKVVVREQDGVHLTKAGSRVALDLVLREMRADHVLD